MSAIWVTRGNLLDGNGSTVPVSPSTKTPTVVCSGADPQSTRRARLPRCARKTLSGRCRSCRPKGFQLDRSNASGDRRGGLRRSDVSSGVDFARAARRGLLATLWPRPAGKELLDTRGQPPLSNCFSRNTGGCGDICQCRRGGPRRHVRIEVLPLDLQCCSPFRVLFQSMALMRGRSVCPALFVPLEDLVF